MPAASRTRAADRGTVPARRSIASHRRPSGSGKSSWCMPVCFPPTRRSVGSGTLVPASMKPCRRPLRSGSSLARRRRPAGRRLPARAGAPGCRSPAQIVDTILLTIRGSGWCRWSTSSGSCPAVGEDERQVPSTCSRRGGEDGRTIGFTLRSTVAGCAAYLGSSTTCSTRSPSRGQQPDELARHRAARRGGLKVDRPDLQVIETLRRARALP
jgi:hypothetical protein